MWQIFFCKRKMTSENSPEDMALIQKGREILRTKDLFKVLDITKTADEKQIKKAYRKVNP